MQTAGNALVNTWESRSGCGRMRFGGSLCIFDVPPVGSGLNHTMTITLIA